MGFFVKGCTKPGDAAFQYSQLRCHVDSRPSGSALKSSLNLYVLDAIKNDATHRV